MNYLLIPFMFVTFVSFMTGIFVANMINPYNQCKKMYTTPEDISECIWIKENP